MDNAARLWALSAVGMYVRHDIVPQLFLLSLGNLVIDVFYMGSQLLDLRLAYVQSHLGFGLGEGHP